jgi:fatty acid desaturase 2 (delta-6 desaturase)
MGRGGFNDSDRSLRHFSREEVASHNTKQDRWIIIDNDVYDVTSWAKKHPGGEKILAGVAGQDATDAWVAFHTNKNYSGRFLKALRVGRLTPSTTDGISQPTPPVLKDFRKLRKTVEELGYFRPSMLFYVFIIGHILLFDLLGWWTLHIFGTGWLPYIVAAILLTTAQAQAGWSQHDFGHLSVFKNNRLNHWTQIFVLNFIKGASCDWWNYRHNNHHSKPNVLRKDPDIRLDYILIVGKVLPLEYGKKKKGYMPYQHQHWYFHFIMPPFLLPIYFNFEIPYFLIKRKRWSELFWMLMFFLRWEFMFAPLLGFWGALGLYMFVRFLESHWFVWTTQMSHLPMAVEYEKQQEDWVHMQLKATCNIEQSWFNDWFSGHLNFQIEHHLFPSMPRHNLHKAAPLVQSLCKKHGIEYQSKTLLRAFKDIISSLKESGEMWYEAYNM